MRTKTSGSVLLRAAVATGWLGASIAFFGGCSAASPNGGEASEAPVVAEAVSASAWLSLAPRQCQTNPWDTFSADTVTPTGEFGTYLFGESGKVDLYFRGRGVAFEAIGFVASFPAPMVCESCSCPRGDLLVVKANDADVARLKSVFGFATFEGQLTYAPQQCGKNPWEEGEMASSTAEERRKLAAWAEREGMPASQAGFLERTDAFVVCAACSCPRGDIAVVVPRDEDAAAKLREAGWASADDPADDAR